MILAKGYLQTPGTLWNPNRTLTCGPGLFARFFSIARFVRLARPAEPMADSAASLPGKQEMTAE
jgi:hypothetical protein